jgi:hypothetical protein
MGLKTLPKNPRLFLCINHAAFFVPNAQSAATAPLRLALLLDRKTPKRGHLKSSLVKYGMERSEPHLPKVEQTA